MNGIRKEAGEVTERGAKRPSSETVDKGDRSRHPVELRGEGTEQKAEEGKQKRAKQEGRSGDGGRGEAEKRPPMAAAAVTPASPRTPKEGSRKIAIAVDLSDESAHALQWAVKNYLRPNDFVVLLHVRPTSVLYGADWGASDTAAIAAADKEARDKMEDDFDALTVSKTLELAKPLDEAGISYKTHIVKDHDMKERICLEVERLGVSACIMGSRGFGAAKRLRKARLGSVSDYCVHHCDCPVVVVRMPEDKNAEAGAE